MKSLFPLLCLLFLVSCVPFAWAVISILLHFPTLCLCLASPFLFVGLVWLVLTILDLRAAAKIRPEDT